MNEVDPKRVTPVTWMAKNNVAANLLMLSLILAGLYHIKHIRQEIQPNYTYSSVLIDVSYPGASPDEVEKSIILPIEERLQALEGISRVVATAEEGVAKVIADIANGENLDRVLQSVRSEVDGISSFPSDSEKPYVRLDDDARWLTTLAIIGDLTDKDFHQLFKRIKQDLLSMDDIIQVTPRIKKELEIMIEVPNQMLNSYDLTLPEIAQTVTAAAKDIPSGELSTQTNNIVLRTEGRRQSIQDFMSIPIKSELTGSVVTLGDISKIKEKFTDSKSFYSQNGQAGLMIYVYQSKNSRTLELAEKVNQYIEDIQGTLPENVKITLPYQRVEKFKQRIQILVNNGITGLLLIVFLLGALLNIRLAFWVAVSIPVVFIGSFTLLEYLGVSINMVSLFAFIMTLGIVVDDAIIIGENIHSKKISGVPLYKAVSEGANEMVLPVVFAVTTNIIAFIPLLILTGDMGNYMRSLPIVAIVVLLVSLLEALFILPAHLNKKEKSKLSMLSEIRKTVFFKKQVEQMFDKLRDQYFARLLTWGIKNRYSTVLIFIGLVVLLMGWFTSGRIGFSWYPRIPSDQIRAQLVLPADGSPSETILLAKKIETAGLEAINKLGSESDVISYSVNSDTSNPTKAMIEFELISEKKRAFEQTEFVQLWREKVGNIPQAQSLKFDSIVGFGRSDGLFVDLQHHSIDALEAAAKELASIFKTISGMTDISDGLSQGKEQIKFQLSQQAKSLGMSEDDLGRQLRGAFFGIEALRYLKDSDQVKVWLRLPEDERNSITDLDDFMTISLDRTQIPLSQAANLEYTKAFTTIYRENGQRTVTVGGSVDSNKANEALIQKLLKNDVFPTIKAKYPGINIGMQGSLGNTNRESPQNFIFKGFLLSSLMVYILIASLFRSYIQGFIIMLTIPFCIAGALAGHVLMEFELTSNSVFGMVALSGIVVNGGFVLTYKMNSLIKQGESFNNALFQATLNRFRPILLTAITTTVGLLPMLFETSEQALFLIPFAIALSFGSVFSILVVLVLIPAFLTIQQDVLIWSLRSHRDNYIDINQ